MGKIIEAVWADGGRFDGWSEHFSYERWVRCAEVALAGTGVDLDWYTTRERAFAEVLPWDHLDSGLDKDWLWQDWEDAVDEVEVEDCRWTPCFDCGVCPDLGTDIQVGPDRPHAAAHQPGRGIPPAAARHRRSAVTATTGARAGGTTEPAARSARSPRSPASSS